MKVYTVQGLSASQTKLLWLESDNELFLLDLFIIVYQEEDTSQVSRVGGSAPALLLSPFLFSPWQKTHQFGYN